jgi:hypothetical protein
VPNVSGDRPSVTDMSTDPVTIDCDSCLVRSPSACGDCVVTVLLGAPPEGVHLDEQEVQALDELARGGLVPPLRLVTPVAGTHLEAG